MSGHCEIIIADALEALHEMPDSSVHCCVTSPPYWGLRDYGVAGQIGIEETPEAHMECLATLFGEVHRVLRDDGTLWINYGDTYLCNQGAGFNGNKRLPAENRRVQVQRPAWAKPKDLLGLPWRLAFALQAAGWYLRCDVIWHKPNPMPESVKDRPTRAHEYLFMLSKSERYYYDHEAVREPSASVGKQGAQALSFARKVNEPARPGQGQEQHRPERADAQYGGATRARRSVWSVPTRPFPEAHFATYPPNLIRPCILAGCPEGGTVLDPFFGAGTTGVVAIEEGRRCIGVELNPEYAEIAQRRIDDAIREKADQDWRRSLLSTVVSHAS